MTSESIPTNRVRQRRTALGLTQAELALHAGISRTAVTAIEGERLVPSVATALSLATVLGTSVEELFGQTTDVPASEVWAWKPRAKTTSCWRAEVSGRTVIYPAGSIPSLTMLPDRAVHETRSSHSFQSNETLVLACCDPAAGILASEFAASTGLRLIVLPRSSRQSVEMLRDGLVHMAGLHLSTREEPEQNAQAVRSVFPADFRMVRLAHWQEGIALKPTTNLHSIRAVMKAKLNWIGRESGSGARKCLDRVMEDRVAPRRNARDHRGVVEAVRSGWADAGICVQLPCEEAGLDFLPVQQEAFDVCIPTKLADDRRIKAFLNVVRSSAYRRLMGELPGYDTTETGNVWDNER